MKIWTSGHLKIQDDILISYSLSEDGETKVDRVFMLTGTAYTHKDKSTLEVEAVSDKSYLEHRVEVLESFFFKIHTHFHSKYKGMD